MVSEPSLVSKLEPSPITESAPRRNLLHSRQIPWGYGRDRLTAIAVDPDRLFVYWEVRDEAIDIGRERLGPAGARASLALRVYDTSGRIFDGDNAHSYFDQDVQRGDRQWFCHVGKPASSAHIELGLRTPDGRFLKLVRSGRVDFPRREVAGWRAPEWMRVVAHTGDIVGRETQHVNTASGAGTSADGGSVQGSPDHASDAGGIDGTLTSVTFGSYETVEFDSYETRQFDFERYETDTGWQVDPVDPTAVYRMVTLSWQELGMGVTTWESGPSESSWQAGPFSYPTTEVIVPSMDRYEGTPQVYRSGEQVRVLHGPWQVVIRGINAHTSRRVLARWEVHRSWVSVATRGAEAVGPGLLGYDGRQPGGSSERFLAASELRLRGASEVFFLGASERRLGGSSELRFLAASQWIARGASERRLTGASEWRLMGSSELRLQGASERRLSGASELRLMGASERRLRKGASEQRLGGASEARLGGASEARIVSISGFPPAPSRKG